MTQPKLHYVEAGIEHQANGSLVLLHGWSLTSRSFLPAFNILQKSFHVVAVDLPGFGDSEDPSGFWGYEAYAQSVVDLLDKLNIQKAHLIGQSTGGGIALCLAACFPKHVSSLVLVNTTGIPMRKQPSVAKRITELVQQYWQSGCRRETHIVIQDMLKNTFKHPRYLMTSVSLPIKHDLRPLLPRVHTPTLLIWGKNDDMLPVEHAHELQQHISGSKLIEISDGHHEWCFIYPERFSAVIEEFYASL